LKFEVTERKWKAILKVKCYSPKRHHGKYLTDLTEADFRECPSIKNHTCDNIRHVSFPNQHPPDAGNGTKGDPPPTYTHNHPPAPTGKATVLPHPSPTIRNETDKSGSENNEAVKRPPDFPTITIPTRDIIIYLIALVVLIVIISAVVVCCIKRRGNKSKISTNKLEDAESAIHNNRQDISPPTPAATVPSTCETPETSLMESQHPDSAQGCSALQDHKTHNEVVRRDTAPAAPIPPQRVSMVPGNETVASQNRALLSNELDALTRHNQVYPHKQNDVYYDTNSQQVEMQHINQGVHRVNHMVRHQAVENPQHNLSFREMNERRDQRKWDRDSGCSLSYQDGHPNQRATYQLNYDLARVETEPKVPFDYDSPCPSYASIHPQIPGCFQQHDGTIVISEYVNGAQM